MRRRNPCSAFCSAHPAGEAQLFVMAERVLVEVIGRIGADSWIVALPSLFDLPGYDEPISIRQTVQRHAHEEAGVPDLLAGQRWEEVGRDTPHGERLGDDPYGAVTRLADAACIAASKVTDGDVLVHLEWGDVSTKDYLWRLTFARTFVAHDIAFGLGSTACPLTEEFSRSAFEATAAKAWRWRSLGLFREPLPLPDRYVSWRDQFLRLAGRDPHPVH